MAPPDPGSVQFQAAGGRVLSPERSKEIIAQLSQGDVGSDMLAHHLAVEQQLAGSPLSLGNRVTLLQNGPDTYAAMLSAITDAHDHINMETYIFEDDDAGRRFADALLAKQRAGVQVNLIRDSVGTLDTPRAFFDRLQHAGIAVVEFNPVDPLRAKTGWDVNQRDHRKLLVVDGRTAVLGGINISSVYSGGSSVHIGKRENTTNLPWRDTDLQIDGPVVATLQKLFMATWCDQKGPPLASRNYFPPLAADGREVVRAIGSGPYQTVNRNYVTLLSAINSAEHDVLLTNAYFVPDPQLIHTLISAVGRGVNVELIVPSVSDSSLVFNAGRAHYQELLRSGVRIYERRQALLHAKTALIDGVWATVGSTNLDWRSFLHNQELTAVILGPEFGAKMREAFERDLAASDEITLKAWERRPLGTRAKEWFGSLWEYWL
ncbi:MAG: phospholipase D-like domain-containing protein [Pseudomonadota bacterium]|nr:phospholipase D-like domain-containing protein [Pseudomonadota bacterium]